jgi:hypothetical protein
LFLMQRRPLRSELVPSLLPRRTVACFIPGVVGCLTAAKLVNLVDDRWNDLVEQVAEVHRVKCQGCTMLVYFVPCLYFLRISALQC